MELAFILVFFVLGHPFGPLNDARAGSIFRQRNLAVRLGG